MTTPSLFSFATSELSQDAFLCWMAALALADASDLSSVGRKFLAWLYESAKGAPCDPETVRLLKPPARQKHKIDIVLQAEIAGTRTIIAIEDKTHTTHHGDQLKRYREALAHALRSG